MKSLRCEDAGDEKDKKLKMIKADIRHQKISKHVLIHL